MGCSPEEPASSLGVCYQGNQISGLVKAAPVVKEAEELIEDDGSILHRLAPFLVIS